MGKSYNTAPSYNQPRQSAELLHGNEILHKLATERLYMLAEAKQRAETAANAIIAMHGVMPSAEQTEHFTPRNVIDATERFEARRDGAQGIARQPEQPVSSQNVMHAEDRPGTYDAPAMVRPDTSFGAPSVEESRATVNQIFDEITRARQEWHAQGQSDASQELGHAA